MKKYDKMNLSKVIVAEGKKLITCRNIAAVTADYLYGLINQFPVVKGDMRHFGRCQRVTILDYTGDDYTQDDVIRPEGSPDLPAGQLMPHFYIDLKHAPLIKSVDLSRFDRKPGCTITIVPKGSVRFINVTVKVCDLFNRELVFDHAWDVFDDQEWIFSYFPKHKFNPDPGNLQITICASEKPRERKEALVDVYELPEEKMRERAVCLN